MPVQPIQPPFALRRRHRRAGDRRLRRRAACAPRKTPWSFPPPAVDVQPSDGIQTAVLAGGCFWGVQGVFQHTAGVVNAVSGYAGGSKATADYHMVSTGTTGHAESVRSSTTRRRSATARSCRSSSRSRTTRPS